MTEEYLNVDWWPQPRQLTFLRACGMAEPFDRSAGVVPEADVVGYGGAAGGGKTDGLLAVGMVAGLRWPGCTIGFFRRTYPELDGLGGPIHRSQELYGAVAAWHGGQRRWTFGTGAQMQFCHCHREPDVYKYQGWQFDVLLFDEATHFTEFQVRYLISRNRATVDGVHPFAAMGTNPGNVGHLWFRDGFVDAGPAEEVHEVEVEPGTHERHKFIPARLDDNLILEERDPGYRRRLEGLPKALQRALLWGDWDVFVGQVFTAWRRDVHAIPPLEIPEHWIRWRAVDWGYRSPWCCLWLARDPDSGLTVVYREAYETELTDPEQAKRIVELTGPDETIKETLGDPSMWTLRTLEQQSRSTADVYREHGVPLRRADNDRLTGLRRVRDALEVDPETESPGLLVFETCPNLIRTLPALPYDDVRVEDVNSDAEDHAYDALRYGLTRRVVKRREPEAGRDVWRRGTTAREEEWRA